MPETDKTDQRSAKASNAGVGARDSELSDREGDERGVSWIGWLLLIYQIVVLCLLVNPWSLELRIGGWVLLAIEGMMLLFWGFPVFLYQIIWKGRSAKESLRIALWSFIDAIGLAVT